ncbi:MAG TPA: alpha/beta fold hydrolase [Polyangia bacterium]|nr:alpha/beta fold hydrolase [Polyangia bacterium]
MQRLTRQLLAALIAGALFAPGAACAHRGSPLAGHWEGSFEREGAVLPVGFDFTVQGGVVTGRFTSPEQAAMEYPLDAPVKVEGTRVSFQIGSGSLALEGALAGEVLGGSLEEGGAPGKFSVRRGAAPVLPYRRSEVTFANGDVKLAGSLFLPGAGAQRPYPAVVLLHGSGPQSRWGRHRYWADQLARAGVATLIYDKRGSGDSGGDWRRSSFEALADDALGAVRLLAARADIDRTRIGLFGHSQGGVIAPLAASRGRPGEVAFVVAADTIAGPIYEQDLYRHERALPTELTPAERKQSLALFRLFVDVARGIKPYDELERASAPVRQTRWYQDLELPPRDHWLWGFYRATGNLDTLPIWSQVKVPVLLVYGQRDQLVPVDEGIHRIEGALAQAGNHRYESVVIPRAAHDLTVRPDPGQPFDWWRQAPGLSALVTAWVKRQGGR